MFLFAILLPGTGAVEVGDGDTYAELINLFKEFRAFQKPKRTDGILNYTISAMKEQKEDLKRFQARLAVIDPSGWTCDRLGR